jgi:hypothetical protein
MRENKVRQKGNGKKLGESLILKELVLRVSIFEEASNWM